MASFFNIKSHKRFDYKPRFYSEEKERIEDLKKRINEQELSDSEREKRIREAFHSNRPILKKKGTLSYKWLLIYLFILILLLLFIFR